MTPAQVCPGDGRGDTGATIRCHERPWKPGMQQAFRDTDDQRAGEGAGPGHAGPQGLAHCCLGALSSSALFVERSGCVV